MTYTKSLKRYKELKSKGQAVQLLTRSDMQARFGFKA